MPIYGIDFGYSKACIATLDNNGKPVVICNLADASDELTAAVFFENAENIIVGSSAKDMIETDGDRVVQFIKRDLGKTGGRVYEFDGQFFNAIEISALILKRLKQMTEEQGRSVNNVVIAMPCYFGMEEKIALKSAVELAGLNLIALITEPVAAVLAYLRNYDQANHNILIYDLGGSTFDVTIVKTALVIDADGNKVQEIKIIAAGGNDELGGKDWDDKLFNYILQACCDENGLLPDEVGVETLRLIRSRIETTKKKLSNAETAKVRVNVNGVMTTITISREDFENLTSDKVTQTMNYVEETLQKAGNIGIDMVLLVGGSTYMPMIRSAVERRFPGKVQFHEPEHAVAVGAAIYGKMLTGNPMPPHFLKQQKVSLYSPNLIAKMIRYLTDHSYDDVAKELINEVDWESLTPEQLFAFFIRIRHLFKE